MCFSVVDDRKTAVALYVRAISELEKGVAAIERLPKALKDTDGMGITLWRRNHPVITGSWGGGACFAITSSP